MSKLVLSDKQQSFVEHYCTDAAFNATKAYIMAGYAPHAARFNASRMITKDNVKTAIAKYKAEIKKEITLNAELQTMRITRQYDKADNKGDIRAALVACDQLNRNIGFYGRDNAQNQPQMANIVFVDGTRTAEEVELMLIQKQKGLGNAVCDG